MRATYSSFSSSVLLFLVMTSSLGAADPLSPCVEDDICSAIIFNQLALAEIKEEMKMYLEDYNESISRNSINGEELTSCLKREMSLKDEVRSLEMKNQKLIPKDQGIDEEVEELRREIDNLKKANFQLEDEKSLLEAVITKQELHIQNLTTMAYRPMDCADLQVQGQTESGVYTIYPYGTDESIEVLCDLESDEGGWTVFFTRQPQDEPLDFNESWENFKNGFGNVNTEYWLGNELLHVLTSRGPTSLRLDAESYFGNKRWAEWNVFSVDNEDTKYQLTLEQYDISSTLGDSFSSNTECSFTTYDSDNDINKNLNCATGSEYSYWGKGGWWYKACGGSRLTAPLSNTNYWNSACWQNWDPVERKLTSIRSLSMKFRRHNYEETADYQH